MTDTFSGLQKATAALAAHDVAKAEYTQKRDKLQKATQDFEGVFIGMMLKQMHKSLDGQNALFGASSESKTYQDMLDDANAQHMSKSGTFGLAKVLFKSMARTLPPDPDAVVVSKTNSVSVPTRTDNQIPFNTKSDTVSPITNKPALASTQSETTQSKTDK